jgi:glycerophosphoryl diester phosphodiesterase
VSKKIIVHGHRGSRGTLPENVIPSFAEARDVGCGFIEFDIHLSKDGVPVVFHDIDLTAKLCMDAHGQVVKTPIALYELTLQEIKSYDVGSIKLPNFPEQVTLPAPTRIPTLEEVMQWKIATAPHMNLNIEIKREEIVTVKTSSPEALASAVMKLLEKYDLVASSLVQSFDFSVVRAVRKLDSRVKLSCLFEKGADFARVAVENGAQVAALNYPLINAENVRACHAAGLEVLPWTVNEQKEWDRLVGLGITSIITDYPRKFINAH